jgi:uncharacterized protein YjeT (DUF2065 family)
MLSLFFMVLGFLLLFEGFFLFTLPEIYLALWKKIFKKESWQETISKLQSFPFFLWRIVGLLEAIIGLFLLNLRFKY